MTTTSHLSFERLADLVENRLDPNAREVALTHVAGCLRCADEMEQLGKVVTLMRTDRESDAPRDLVAYAKSVFQSRARRSESSVLRRLVAALTFDSLTSKPEFAVRSGASNTRQLLFSAEENDLDLRIATQEDGRLISGQVLGSTCPGGEVELKGTDITRSARLNELCEFTMSVVPPGNYSLRLKLSDIEIEVPEFDV
jgi:hypothetical protein